MNRTPLTELTANGVTIGINQIETPKGERLEIKTPSSSIGLDAVALEALTWQENDELANLPSANIADEIPQSPRRDNQSGRTRLMTVSNEFGFVVVYECQTDTDIWIDFEAEKQGELIRLCSAELEILAQQDQDLFTQWIKTDLNR